MNPVATQILGHYLRKSSLVMSAAALVRGVRDISSLEELDDVFRKAMTGNAEVTPEALVAMGRARFVPPAEFLAAGDPFSPEYALLQKRLYALVAKKAYATENEATNFDFEKARHDFFPYNTRSPEFVGLQLQAQGFVIRNLALKPGSRIVEFGAGWGNMAMHLTMMGFDVTAVELNPPSISLMKHRAEIHQRIIRFANQDMVAFAAETGERFHAALFVASFHHCDDHNRLLANLDRIIEDDGCVIFADEPIVPARTPFMPYPWGLRLEGHSLYYVRNHGWLELGFQESYFREALRRAGWQARCIQSTVRNVGDLYIATRIPKARRG